MVGKVINPGGVLQTLYINLELDKERGREILNSIEIDPSIGIYPIFGSADLYTQIVLQKQDGVSLIMVFLDGNPQYFYVPEEEVQGMIFPGNGWVVDNGSGVVALETNVLSFDSIQGILEGDGIVVGDQNEKLIEIFSFNEPFSPKVEGKKVIINKEHLINIANAIRSKTNKTELIKGMDLASEINTIPGAGNYVFYVVETDSAGNSVRRKATTNEIINGEVDEVIMNEQVDLTNIGFNGWKFTKLEANSAKELPASFLEHCDNITELYFPKVENIKSDAFYYCRYLKKVTLSSIKNIERYAFSWGFDKLSALIIENTDSVCVLGGGLFRSTFYGNIYVPDSLVDDYKVATNWVQYASQIKPLSELSE